MANVLAGCAFLIVVVMFIVQGAVGCQCWLVVDGGLRAYVVPFFTHELEDRTVMEGGTVSLIARVEAYPAVGVLWQVSLFLSTSTRFPLCLASQCCAIRSNSP